MFSPQFLSALQSVNEDVACDVSVGDESEMASICLDIGHSSMTPHSEELQRLFREHGHDAVIAEAAKHVSLA